MALRPRSRLLAAVATAVVALAGLTACRSDPQVAAYIADRSYSVEQINGMVDELRSVAQQGLQVPPPGEIVGIVTLKEACTRYAEAHGIPVAPQDPAALAQRLGLPADSPFAQVFAGYTAAAQALQQAAKSEAPTPEDQRQVQANAVGQGGAPVTQDLRPYLTEDAIGRVVGFRNLLAAAVREADVTINPRFAVPPFRVTVQLGEAQSYLSVPLGPQPPVTDLSEPAA